MNPDLCPSNYRNSDFACCLLSFDTGGYITIIGKLLLNRNSHFFHQKAGIHILCYSFSELI